MSKFFPTLFDPDVLTAATLDELLQGNEPFVLIDVLPPEHYEKIHIPGAKNACVYEVDFLDQVAKITSDKRAPIVLYGAGDDSLDAIAAAGKLTRAQYSDVNVLEGGIEEWDEAGYTFEGTAPVPDEAEQPFIPDIEGDNTWSIIPEESTLQWFGRNASTTHHGTVPVEGHLAIKDAEFSGSTTIHIQDLQNADIEDPALKPVLEEHLKSDDFFFTSLFPKATFTIKSAELTDDLSPTIPNLIIYGELELRGITQQIEFPATVSHLPDGRISLEAHLDIDRTRWGIIYGSTRFFKHLSYHLVFDDITLFVRLVAR